MVPNLNATLKKGGRKAMRLGFDDFIKKYITYCQKHDSSFDMSINYDTLNIKSLISSGNFPIILYDDSQKFKVKFDMENYGLEKVGTTTAGIPYVSAWYGGDWEFPLVVFYYFDNKGRLTNYIPTYGNCWNIYSKTAFGSEEDSDKFDYNKDDQFDFLKRGLVKGGINISGLDEDDIHNLSLDYDFNSCLKDFESRVTI